MKLILTIHPISVSTQPAMRSLVPAKLLADGGFKLRIEVTINAAGEFVPVDEEVRAKIPTVNPEFVVGDKEVRC